MAFRVFKRWMYEEPYVTAAGVMTFVGLSMPIISQSMGWIDKRDPIYQEPTTDLKRDCDFNRVLSDGKMEYIIPSLNEAGKRNLMWTNFPEVVLGPGGRKAQLQFGGCTRMPQDKGPIWRKDTGIVCEA